MFGVAQNAMHREDGMEKEKFLFGVSTSATQIEGGAFQDGKGETCWDYYSANKFIKNGQTCFTACDSYNRLKEDLDLIGELEVNAYRFSISWARLQSLRTGEINRKGIDYYNRLIDGLLEIGVTPFVTLFHWDMPMELYRTGGFEDRKIAERFFEYGKIVAENFGDRVKYFSVFNEPLSLIDFLYCHPLGQAVNASNNGKTFECVHNLLLANAAATEALRKYGGKRVRVGMVNCSPVRIPKTAADEETARRAMFEAGDSLIEEGALFWDPLVFGRHNPRLIEKYGLDTSCIREGDMERIRCKPDFMGLNIYCGTVVETGKDGEIVKSAPSLNCNYGDMGGDIAGTADSMYWGVKFMYERYKLPIYVTENGCSLTEWKDLSGKVEDPMRADYIRRYFASLMKAKKEVPVMGYFVWTLMDNFEWSSGFTRRFGLVYVDFETLKRTKKSSFYAYRDLIKDNLKNM